MSLWWFGSVFLKRNYEKLKSNRLAQISLGLAVSISYLLWRKARFESQYAHFPNSNWGRNAQAKRTMLLYPHSEEEIRTIVSEANRFGHKVKVIGGLHSWSDIAMLPDESDSVQTIHLCLDKFNKVLQVDRVSKTVTVECGIHIWELNQFLPTVGLAFPILGSIASQSIAGALSTGTHGSGLNQQSLANYLVELDIMAADGRVLRCSENFNSQLFRAAQVSLGAIGVLLRAKLRFVDAFELEHQYVMTSLDDILANLSRYQNDYDFFKFLLFPFNRKCRMFLQRKKRRTTAAVDCVSSGALPNTTQLKHQMDDIFITKHIYATTVLPLSRALPDYSHVLLDFSSNLIGDGDLLSDRSDRVFNYLYIPNHQEIEYNFPVEHTERALRKLCDILTENQLPVNIPMEIRFVAADPIYMSMANGHTVCSVTLCIAQSNHNVHRVLRAVEPFLLSLGGRPHWGKIHSLNVDDVKKLYLDFDKFMLVRKQMDPLQTFVNPYLQRVLGLSEKPQFKCVRCSKLILVDLIVQLNRRKK